MKIGLTRISLKCAIVLVACRVYCCLGKSRNEEAFVTYHGISNGVDINTAGSFRDTHLSEKTSSGRFKRSTSSSLVDIARYTDTSAAGKMHIAYVDDTMTKLIFKVAVERSNPVIMAATPSGMPSSVHPVLNGSSSTGTVTATFETPITAADYGFWKFTKLDANTWDVTIQCESPVYITQQLYDISTGNPVKKYPVVGTHYKLQVTVTGISNVKSVSLGFLYTRSKISPIKMAPLMPKGGGVFEAASLAMPDQVFMVGVQGQDKSRHLFKRLDTTEITPVTLSLDIPPYTGATVIEYSTFNISFTVTNLLTSTQEIDVRITDDRGFAQAPKFLSATLKVGEKFTGTFTLKAEFAGLTTLATIKARQYKGSGQFSSGPVEYRNVTVIKNETTTTSTTTTSTTTTPSTTTPTTTTSTTTTPSTTTSTTTTSTTPTTTTTSTTSSSTTTKATTTKPTTSTLTSTKTTLTTTKSSTVSSIPTHVTASVSTNAKRLSTKSVRSTVAVTKSSTSKPNSVVSGTNSATITSTTTTAAAGKNNPATSTSLKFSSFPSSSTSSMLSTASKQSATSIVKRIATSSSSITTAAKSGGSGYSTASGSSGTQSGKASTTASSNSGSGSNTSNDDDDDSTKLEISAGVIVASMVTGTIVGVAAIATMAVVFNKALHKKDKRVSPEDKQNPSDRSMPAVWT